MQREGLPVISSLFSWISLPGERDSRGPVFKTVLSALEQIRPLVFLSKTGVEVGAKAFDLKFESDDVKVWKVHRGERGGVQSTEAERK